MNILDRKFLDFTRRDLQNILITREFIAYRDRLADKFKDSFEEPRTPKQKLMDADCLLVEYTLLKKKVVEAPTALSHDFKLDGHLVDVKVINANSFTINNEKRAWFKYGVSQRELTHFAFWSFKVERTEPLKAGDSVSFNYKSSSTAQHVLDNIWPSKWPDKPPYYKVVTVQPAYDSV